MAFDKDAFMTALDSMSVMELNDLVKAIEEKFGVFAAAMAAPAGAGGGGAEEGRAHHRSRAAGLVQGSAGHFQATEGSRVRDRNSAQSQRQDPEAGAARAVQGLGARAGMNCRRSVDSGQARAS